MSTTDDAKAEHSKSGSAFGVNRMIHARASSTLAMGQTLKSFLEAPSVVILPLQSNKGRPKSMEEDDS